ncbi:unnamed protein product [Echinostoma caproni]|uniref:Transmembrane protein n=1 Tax=Echinostoma caproni TaxID=27848 RepID=A0A183B4N8_9TREM|nr:unnamed protein product [Echinostoma caproni]
MIKDFTFLQIIYYLVLTSFTFANFGQPVKQFRWSTNPLWCISILVILVVQTFWFLLHALRWDETVHTRLIHLLHPAVIAVDVIWCPILVILNEIVSWKERSTEPIGNPHQCRLSLAAIVDLTGLVHSLDSIALACIACSTCFARSSFQHVLFGAKMMGER